MHKRRLFGDDWTLGLPLLVCSWRLVTTAGTLLFGMLGATLAAPVTAVGLRTIGLLRDASLFGVAATPALA